MSIDLKQLNTELGTNSYFGGVSPSAKDNEVFELIRGHGGLTHVARWFRHMESFTSEERKAWKACAGAKAEAKPAADDDDLDLFGDVDSEEERRQEEEFDRRAKEAQARIDAKNKAKGKNEAAKSMLVIDVKPYSDETDLNALAKQILDIKIDGLVWGDYKLIDVAFGVKKISVSCSIEDEKVPSTEIIEEMIGEMDDVQSADVASMNKM
ncbi:putative Elongation factor 1-beta [Blattamonas nauphoetae]|uniref:Elongation factor 1-beta n=1 Tax=Blattamonas nauphoetae TaxID=2049346 RepID=A0ABQ9YKP1_9EUKA|nr:putative Elongation factor 1-beta [Blattamonas nauphoetae]